MKFSYKKFQVRLSEDQRVISVWRPIIPVRFRYGDSSIKLQCLIDSGADFCILPEELGSALEIPFDETREYQFEGITGEPAQGHFHRVGLEVNEMSIKSDVVFSNALGENHFGILGQKGFFEYFRISFDYQSFRINISR